MHTQLIQELNTVLKPSQILSGDQLQHRFHHIWKMDEPLEAVAVVIPTTTQEVSSILKICNEVQQRVSIHGGLTNLVGGTETLKEELVISLEKLNKIEELDASSRTMTVQSGVILEQIQKQAKENDLFFPLNFGAKGSAQIGGIISTNAGGLRVLRYGMTRNLVLGIEAVLMDGTIISSMKKIIKDNSGYDLKQLFIGSEGTIGVVTKAILKLQELPSSRVSAMVSINEYQNVVLLLKLMDAGFAGSLSGFELMWKSYYNVGTSAPSLMKPPLPQDSRYYVLVESLARDQSKDILILEQLLETALERGLIEDAVIASTEADLQWFWQIREDVHAITSQMNYDQHFDISLPIPLIGKTIDQIVAELKLLNGVEQVVTFGHVADGNIHLIIGKNESSQELTNSINEVIYRPLKTIGGSISAEHGIGVHKKAYLHLCRSDEEINIMKTIKRSLDPNNLLNRGRIFDL